MFMYLTFELIKLGHIELTNYKEKFETIFYIYDYLNQSDAATFVWTSLEMLNLAMLWAFDFMCAVSVWLIRHEALYHGHNNDEFKSY